MKKTSLAIFTLLVSSMCWAQNYLEPDNSAFNGSQVGYYVTVGKVLNRKLPRNSTKVLILPSNQRESIVGIAPEKNRCAIVYGRVDLLLWRYEVAADEPNRRRELLKDYPKDPLDVPVTVQQRNTSKAMCDRITKVWEAALLQTRYERSCLPDRVCEVIVDGVTFHFSTLIPSMGVLAGKAHSPKPDSPLGHLVSLVYTMRRYAESDTEVGARELETALELVEEDLP